MSNVEMHLAESKNQATSVHTMVQRQAEAYAQARQNIRHFTHNTSLEGEAYHSAKQYFSRIIEPLVQGGEVLAAAVATAVGRFPAEYVAYVDSIDLNQGELEQQIARTRQHMFGAQALRDRLIGSDVSQEYKTAALANYINILTSYERLEHELEAKLEKLMAFNAVSPSIFSDIQSLHAAVSTGLAQTRTAWNADTGTFAMPQDLSWVRVIKSYKKNNPIIYDEDGHYGGDQGSPYRRYNPNYYSSFKDIIRKYYPDMSDDEIVDYLSKLNSEGCGYVALANTFFNNYCGSEKEFEKTFGFPMYREENGTKIFNVDDFVVDLYASQDNHFGVDSPRWSFDTTIPFADLSNVQGSGTTKYSREYRFKRYLDAHGIDVDVDNGDFIGIKGTVENYEKYKNQGDIIVAILPLVLENQAGDEVDHRFEGHIMTVTGTTEDGRLIVSSWGRTLYVDPAKVLATFQIISYP